ncbi:hypothetical protein DL546_000967 [Coniochaeta pulveracea]|uniref:pH-response regulator protein palC n=1 Tax=Coniochaeta pulveracea TaxID=177199 RepID=A0A420YBF3_9PEZI|nr:hypothetical protein DL546_000967 [Coniochaeta pulveracea]
MPYPFVLPTTSSFSFSTNFTSDSHPSLPLSASTYRGVVRSTLKAHKRLPPSSQQANLNSVASSLTEYIPYLLALIAGLSHNPVSKHEVRVTIKSWQAIEWRPTLSPNPVPGHEPPRVKINNISQELSFILTTLANTRANLARAALQPLYITSSAPPTVEQRTSAIQTATRHLLDAASIYDYLANNATESDPSPPVDISPQTIRAQRALALAEATLLAVLKDDPYPAAAAADRNTHDTEWMYKAPDIPKVRVLLFARLCLAAAEHAHQAYSLCSGQRISSDFITYLDDLRRTARAKACRLFGVDAEMSGKTGEAIGWLQAALGELGVERGKDAKKSSGLGLGKLKREWSEKREDKKVERGGTWGTDAGRLEETRVVEMLEKKWVKQNDTMFTQPITPPAKLLAEMPSGREIHRITPWEPPILDSASLEATRAPPERTDEAGGDFSSDDETLAGTPVGAFPGTQGEYRTATPNYY